EAAALPLTFLTAYRMLATKARLQRGETLLVVGAGAGVSVAAIAIGHHLGAHVMATSRSLEKMAAARQLGAADTVPSDGISGPRSSRWARPRTRSSISTGPSSSARSSCGWSDLRIAATILITNDDGITSAGLHALSRALRRLGEVVIVAPDAERSAVGHAITTLTPLRVKEFKVAGKPAGYAVSGTPADCVKLAVGALLGRRPDLVVS